MEKLVDFFYKLDIAFGKIKFFEALKRSFTMMIPVFIIGAFSLVMMYFPIEAVRNEIDGTFVFNVLETIHYATYGIAVIYLLFAFSYRYSETFEKNNTLRLFYIVNAIMVYFIFLGPTVIMNKEEGLHVIDYLSVKNIFPALIICVLSTNLFRLIHNLLVKKRNVPNHTVDVGKFVVDDRCFKTTGWAFNCKGFVLA